MDKYDYLTSGEELKCSCGTEKAELKVAVRRTLTIDDKRIATMVDSLPDDNIGCFGQCMANPDAPAPCMFEGFWVDGCKRVTVDGFPALTKNSALICTKGQGVIVPRDNEIVEEKYKKILEGKNGLQKIHNKNNKYLEKMESSENAIEAFHKAYFKVVKEKEQREKQFKESIIKNLEENGIDKDWYSLEGDESKYLSYSIGGSLKSGRYYINCKEEDVPKVILRELIAYRREYEFMQGNADYYVYEIEVVHDDIGRYYGKVKNNKCVFEISHYEEISKDKLKEVGYQFYRYDQYGATFHYTKEIDDSSFEKIKIKYKCRDKEGNIKEKTKTMKIPADIKDEILDYIKKSKSLIIRGNELCKKFDERL